MNAEETLAAMTAEQIMACVDLCDGHTIFKPSAFVVRGLPEEGLHNFAEAHQSDGSPKGNITDLDTGAFIEEIGGIYGLQFLERVARALNVDYEGCMGRGFQARKIQKALKEHFENLPGKGKD